MRHEINTHKEWYTCDRCGSEIKNVDIGKDFSRFPLIRNKHYKLSEFRTLSLERCGCISKSELIIPEIVSVEITESYFENRKTIHLCGKCRKEFDNFMKNK